MILTHQFHSALYLVDDGDYLVNAWHSHCWGIEQVGEWRVTGVECNTPLWRGDAQRGGRLVTVTGGPVYKGTQPLTQ